MKASTRACTRVAFLLIAAVIALFTHASALAATKIDEGFATRMWGDGNRITGVNKVSTAKAGDELYYWIQWKDHPKKVTYRCVVKLGGPDGETLVDETEKDDDADEEGYSTCGLETEEGGTYYFAQYLDGEMVGDRRISIEKRSFFGKLSLYKQFKWALGGLAAIVLAFFWVRKKMGKGNEIDKAFPEFARTAGAAAPVVIGSKVEGGAIPQPAAPPAPKPPEPAEQLKQFKARLAVDPTYRIAEPKDVLPIAKAARAAGEPNVAVAALRGFDKAFPGHELIPDVFVFTAKLMAEDLKNPAMARKILEHITVKYPGHYLAQEAKRYLQTLPAA